MWHQVVNVHSVVNFQMVKTLEKTSRMLMWLHRDLMFQGRHSLRSGPLCWGAWSHEKHRFIHFVLYLSKNTKFKVVEWSSQNPCCWNCMTGLDGLRVHAIKPQNLNKLEHITREARNQCLLVRMQSQRGCCKLSVLKVHLLDDSREHQQSIWFKL